jgi:hypothetical protein
MNMDKVEFGDMPPQAFLLCTKTGQMCESEPCKSVQYAV